MRRQRRGEQSRHDTRPIDFQIEGVQLAAVMERTDHEGNQAKNGKMNGARRIPSPDEDEQSDEEVQQAYNAEIIFNGDRFVRRRGDQAGFKLLARARDVVAEMR